jgi:hypothetical protein
MVLAFPILHQQQPRSVQCKKINSTTFLARYKLCRLKHLDMPVDGGQRQPLLSRQLSD